MTLTLHFRPNLLCIQTTNSVGNGKVGCIVLADAVKQLTPVIFLELDGKSLVVIVTL